MDLAWCGTNGWAFLMDNGKWKMENCFKLSPSPVGATSEQRAEA